MRLNYAPLLRLEAPSLHAVSANFHIAPAAGVIFAGIQKQPAAPRIATLSHQANMLRCQKIHGCLRQNPPRKPGLRCIRRPRQLQLTRPPAQRPICLSRVKMTHPAFFNRVLRGSPLIHNGVEDLCRRLPQMSCLLQSRAWQPPSPVLRLSPCACRAFSRPDCSAKRSRSS